MPRIDPNSLSKKGLVKISNGVNEKIKDILKSNTESKKFNDFLTKILKNPNNVPHRDVESVKENWFEFKYNSKKNVYRIFYLVIDGVYYLSLIGDKNTQQEDINNVLDGLAKDLNNYIEVKSLESEKQKMEEKFNLAKDNYPQSPTEEAVRAYEASLNFYKKEIQQKEDDISKTKAMISKDMQNFSDLSNFLGIKKENTDKNNISDSKEADGDIPKEEVYTVESNDNTDNSIEIYFDPASYSNGNGNGNENYKVSLNNDPEFDEILRGEKVKEIESAISKVANDVKNRDDLEKKLLKNLNTTKEWLEKYDITKLKDQDLKDFQEYQKNVIGDENSNETEGYKTTIGYFELNDDDLKDEKGNNLKFYVGVLKSDNKQEKTKAYLLSTVTGGKLDHNSKKYEDMDLIMNNYILPETKKGNEIKGFKDFSDFHKVYELKREEEEKLRKQKEKEAKIEAEVKAANRIEEEKQAAIRLEQTIESIVQNINKNIENTEKYFDSISETIEKFNNVMSRLDSFVVKKEEFPENIQSFDIGNFMKNYETNMKKLSEIKEDFDSKEGNLDSKEEEHEYLKEVEKTTKDFFKEIVYFSKQLKIKDINRLEELIEKEKEKVSEKNKTKIRGNSKVVAVMAILSIMIFFLSMAIEQSEKNAPKIEDSQVVELQQYEFSDGFKIAYEKDIITTDNMIKILKQYNSEDYIDELLYPWSTNRVKETDESCEIEYKNKTDVKVSSIINALDSIDFGSANTDEQRNLQTRVNIAKDKLELYKVCNKSLFNYSYKKFDKWYYNYNRFVKGQNFSDIDKFNIKLAVLGGTALRNIEAFVKDEINKIPESKNIVTTTYRDTFEEARDAWYEVQDSKLEFYLYLYYFLVKDMDTNYLVGSEERQGRTLDVFDLLKGDGSSDTEMKKEIDVILESKKEIPKYTKRDAIEKDKDYKKTGLNVGKVEFEKKAIYVSFITGKGSIYLDLSDYSLDALIEQEYVSYIFLVSNLAGSSDATVGLTEKTAKRLLIDYKNGVIPSLLPQHDPLVVDENNPTPTVNIGAVDEYGRPVARVERKRSITTFDENGNTVEKDFSSYSDEEWEDSITDALNGLSFDSELETGFELNPETGEGKFNVGGKEEKFNLGGNKEDENIDEQPKSTLDSIKNQKEAEKEGKGLGE